MANKKHQPAQPAPNSGKSKPPLGLLRYKTDGSHVTVQHYNSSASGQRGSSVLTLRVDLKEGKVQVGYGPALPESGSNLVLGLAGLLRLGRGCVLVLVTHAKRVCGLLDGPVYKVEDVALVAPEAINGSETDLRLAALLQEGLSPKAFGCHLYVSHTANITSSRQRVADLEPALPPPSLFRPSSPAAAGAAATAAVGGPNPVPQLGAWWERHAAVAAGAAGNADTSSGGRAAATSGPATLWGRADPRFLWNGELMRPILEAGGEAFALPLMAGYVGQATGATFKLRAAAATQDGNNGSSGGGGGGGGGRGGSKGLLRRVAEGSEDDAAGGGGSSSDRDAGGGGRGGGRGGANPGAAGASGATEGEGEGGGWVEAPGELTLITRLGAGRPVAGSWRRGADLQGNTAGFAETEVVLTLWAPDNRAPAGGAGGAGNGPKRTGQPSLGPQGPQQPQQQEAAAGATDAAAAAAVAAAGSGGQEGGKEKQQDGEGEGAGEEQPGPDGMVRRRQRVAVGSFVMARGSAPLLWAAPPDMNPFAPPPPTGPPLLQQPQQPQQQVEGDTGSGSSTTAAAAPSATAAHEAAFEAHVAQLRQSYGQPLLLLNLIHGRREGGQLRLHDTLMKLVEAYNAQQRKAAAAHPQPPSSAAPTHQPPTHQPPTAPQLPLGLLGMLLGGGELADLAGCGPAAARLEAECSGHLGAGGAYLAVEELELAHPYVPPPPPPTPSTEADGSGDTTPSAASGGVKAASKADAKANGKAAAGAAKGVKPGAKGGAAAPPATPNAASAAAAATINRHVRCVGRHVACRQRGVVRVSSASATSAGGCCEEVDLAQHCLALPALAGLLVAGGALEAPEAIAAAHTSVMHALAQLWAHQAHVLSDQVHGTAAAAGRTLEAAAEGMEAGGGGGGLRGLVRALTRRPWRMAQGISDWGSRLYYSHFTDARRQDCLDLTTGVYKVAHPPEELPRRRPPNTTALQLGVLLLLASVLQVALCLWQPPAPEQGGRRDALLRSGAAAAIGLLLLAEVLRRGSSYVETPLLRPQDTMPWAAAAGPAVAGAAVVDWGSAGWALDGAAVAGGGGANGGKD